MGVGVSYERDTSVLTPSALQLAHDSDATPFGLFVGMLATDTKPESGNPKPVSGRDAERRAEAASWTCARKQNLPNHISDHTTFLTTDHISDHVDDHI